MIKIIILKSMVADMVAGKNNIRYSNLCHFLTKKQARLVLDCINSSTNEELESFLLQLDNSKLDNKLKKILL